MIWNRFYTVTLLGVGLTALGCQEESVRQLNMPTYEMVAESHTAKLANRNFIDIIWIIDDSVSMKPYQDAVSENFTVFIKGFENTDLDFVFSIISTSVTGGRAPDGVMNHSLTSLTSNALESNPEKFVKDAQTSIQIGIEGSVDEQGLWNLKRHLEKYGPNSINPYLRPYSETVVVYLSDEVDSSANGAKGDQPFDPESEEAIDPSTANDYLSAYREIMGKESIKFFAIINPAIEDHRWNALTEETGGQVASINEDFSGILETLGEFVAEQKVWNLIYLEKNALFDENMKVLVNGTPLPREAWKYFESSNLIQIDKNLVNEGDEVETWFNSQTNPSHVPGAF